jgi:multiple sugar transport system permease protein
MQTFRRGEDRVIIGILVFSLAYLVVVQGYPFIWAILISARDQHIGTSGNFVGFANYLSLFSDSTFWSAMSFTFVYVFAAIVLKLFFGYIMAAMLNQPIVGRGFFRALLFLPWALPTLTSVLAWRWMLGDIGGVVNYALMQLHLIPRPVGWLGQPALAQVSVVMVNIWRGTPFFGISILAALQSISPELYEVARIDGANARQRLFRITLPSISNVIILVTLISTIWTLGDFAIIWIMTRGGPANTTQVFSTLSYVVTFQNLELSRGIAIALAIVPVSIVLMIVAIRFLFGKKEGER